MSTPLRPLPDHDPLKTSEVAAALGCNPAAVMAACRRGQFPGAFRTPGSGRGPGRWRIPRADALAVGRRLGVFSE